MRRYDAIIRVRLEEKTFADAAQAGHAIAQKICDDAFTVDAAELESVEKVKDR